MPPGIARVPGHGTRTASAIIAQVPIAESHAVARPKPVLLLILDGWGHREDPTDNAVAQARLPNWQALLRDCPHTLVHTSGLKVGLPEGQMGNSEVGHMNLGAGRVVYQDLTRIDAAIHDRSFYTNPALLGACQAARDNAGTLHVLGLLSPGGVHSHEDHIFALLDLARQQGVGRIAVHAFLDGRDTPPRSARASLEKLLTVCARTPGAFVSSVSGRYYAMDRDQRWDRVEKAYRAVAEADAPWRAADPLAALDAAYAREENDEFVQPTVIEGASPMQNGDAVIFMNFRADRAREMSRCFVTPDEIGFTRPRAIDLASFVCLAEYDATLPATVAYGPETLEGTFPEVLAAQGLSQLRIAETEKYAHVTFFFNGGREQVWPGEERILVPSPRVATYDLQPEMSAPEVTRNLVEAIESQRFDAIICNLANPDMVGHTGDLGAAIRAAEAIDAALGAIVSALRKVGGEMILTADHGNLEMMRDPATGQPHTAHTTGPVPLVYFGRPARVLDDGALKDVAPSLLYLLGIKAPAQMTGHSLIEFLPVP